MLDSRKLPGKVTAGGAAGVNPKDYDLVGLAMQEPQYRSPGVRELLDAVAKSKRALHVDHEHAAAALRQAHPRPRLRCAQARLHRSDGVGQFRSRPADAEQPRSAGDPSAGREGQRAAWSRCRPISRSRKFDNDKYTAILRQLEKDIDAARFDTPEGKIELPVKLKRARFDFRAAGEMGDAARRQLSLHHQRRHAHRARSGAYATSRSRARSTISSSTSASSSAPTPSDLVPFEKYAAAAQSLIASGFGRARAAKRRAQYRARRQAGAADRQAEGPEPSGDRRDCRAGRFAARGQPQEGRGGLSVARRTLPNAVRKARRGVAGRNSRAGVVVQALSAHGCDIHATLRIFCRHRQFA